MFRRRRTTLICPEKKPIKVVQRWDPVNRREAATALLPLKQSDSVLHLVHTERQTDMKPNSPTSRTWRFRSYIGPVLHVHNPLDPRYTFR